MESGWWSHRDLTSASCSGRRSNCRQTLIAADQVGCVHSQSSEGGGRETRLVSLVADQNHPSLDVNADDAAGTGWSQPPFQHVPVDYERPRDVAVATSLLNRSDVDDQGTCGLFGFEGVGRDPQQPGAGGSEQIVDGAQVIHPVTNLRRRCVRRGAALIIGSAGNEAVARQRIGSSSDCHESGRSPRRWSLGLVTGVGDGDRK